MTRLSNLTYRNFLIAVHDALATIFAFLASFYLRFEGGQSFFDRLPLLLYILPYFVAFSVVVCYAFNLTTTKWRFISLPDGLNILRTATVLTVALLVSTHFRGTECLWRFLSRQGHYRSILVS
jgi:O-antigen biosynthesis protein WbqV